MNHTLRDWIGAAVRTDEADIGTVEHLCFDDLTWHVRYVSVRLRGRAPARRVLLSTAAFGKPDWTKRELPARLTLAQIRDSPRREEGEAVTRQHEDALHRHYLWPLYWAGGIFVPSAYLATLPSLSERVTAAEETAARVHRLNPHLRETHELLESRVLIADGAAGHIEDLVVDDDTWCVRYFVVNTRNWLAGRRVLVSPRWLTKVDWANKEVAVDLTRKDIKASPAYDPSKPLSLDYETRLLEHLQKPESAEWVVFKLHAAPGSHVCVAGNFNAWDREAIPLGDTGHGLFTATVLLPLGKYEYKYVVNGAWENGPDCAEQIPNAFGTANNVLVVTRTASHRVRLHTFQRQPHAEERPMWYSPTRATG